MDHWTFAREIYKLILAIKRKWLKRPKTGLKIQLISSRMSRGFKSTRENLVPGAQYQQDTKTIALEQRPGERMTEKMSREDIIELMKKE